MRNFFLGFCIFTIVFISIMTYIDYKNIYLSILFLPLIGMGLYDMLQKKHAIRRNFPLIGRMRYVFEEFRPEIRQYFGESDTNGTPFNRLQRDVVYQRAKKAVDTVPFGTQLNVYDPGYEYVAHSIRALSIEEVNDAPRVRIGSPQCTQPYEAALYNISAMSYGSLSKNAIIALNEGAAIGGFYHNTGEGGLTHYHLEGGGDVTWNIGTGYFSTRTPDGKFSIDRFRERANHPSVKMIEIKFSQGAKPGHGGILPKEKVTQEIADIRLVNMGEDVVSPPRHSAFTNPDEMMTFVSSLREASGGKPIGIKICIGNPEEFIDICKAMVRNNVYLDFITVDGGEGGTGAAPPEYSDHVGMPLRDALVFVFDALKGFGLKQHIKIIASGKIITGFDVVKTLSLGADLCNSARGMMFALGCIQALECNLNTCPVGVATQDPDLMKGLVPEQKKVRVANFQKQTVRHAVELMCSAGIDHPDKVDRSVVHRRVDEVTVRSYLQTYPELEEGCLLSEETTPALWKSYMHTPHTRF